MNRTLEKKAWVQQLEEDFKTGFFPHEAYIFPYIQVLAWEGSSASWMNEQASARERSGPNNLHSTRDKWLGEGY